MNEKLSSVGSRFNLTFPLFLEACESTTGANIILLYTTNNR